MDVISNRDAQLQYLYYQCCIMHNKLSFIVVLENLDMANILYMV